MLSFCYLFRTQPLKAVFCVGAFGSGAGRVGGGRWSRVAHAQSVGNAIENAELCRALRKASWTPPLGTTAGVLEVSPGDGRLLTGDNNKTIPGDKENPLSPPRQRRRSGRSTSPSPLPPSPPLRSPAFGCAREIPRRCCR